MAATASTPRTSALDDNGPATSARRAGQPGRGRGALRTLLIAVAAGAAGYFGGWVHGGLGTSLVQQRLLASGEEHEQALDELNLAHEQALATARAATEESRAQVASLTDLTALYEGLRKGQHALQALDARNFGVAETHLREAQQLLAPLGSRVEGLPPIAEKIGSTRVVVAGNLSEQRQAVQKVFAQLDDLISARRAAMRVAAPIDPKALAPELTTDPPPGAAAPVPPAEPRVE